MDYLLAIYLVLCVYTKKSINQSNLMHSINVKVKISLSQLNKKSINILIRCKNEYFLMIQPKPVSLSVISVLLVCRRKLKWHHLPCRYFTLCGLRSLFLIFLFTWIFEVFSLFKWTAFLGETQSERAEPE